MLAGGLSSAEDCAVGDASSEEAATPCAAAETRTETAVSTLSFLDVMPVPTPTTVLVIATKAAGGLGVGGATVSACVLRKLLMSS